MNQEVTEQMVIDFVKAGLKLIGAERKLIPIRFDRPVTGLACLHHFESGYMELLFSIDAMKNKNPHQYTWQQCVAHELIHVKQVLSGDLKVNDGRTYWKDKDATDWRETAMMAFRLGDKRHYRNLPWEDEAFTHMTEFANIIERSISVVA